jgi:hypothetical protein
VDSNHHGIATASPSSWCVCQFRHDRAVLILSAEDLLCQIIGRIPIASQVRLVPEPVAQVRAQEPEPVRKLAARYYPEPASES